MTHEYPCCAYAKHNHNSRCFCTHRFSKKIGQPKKKRTGKDSIKSLMNSYNNLYEANLAFKVKLMLTFPHKVHIINIVLHMKYIETTSCLSSSAG